MVTTPTKQQLQYIFLESTASTDPVDISIDVSDLITDHNDGYGCNFVAFVDMMVHRAGNSTVQVTRYIARWSYYHTTLQNASDGSNPTEMDSTGTVQSNISSQTADSGSGTIQLVLVPTTIAELNHLIKITLFVWDGATI